MSRRASSGSSAMSGSFNAGRMIVLIPSRRAASVYRRPDRQLIRGLTVDELRAELGVTREPPLAEKADRVSFLAWSLAAAALVVGPLALLLAALL